MRFETPRDERRAWLDVTESGLWVSRANAEQRDLGGKPIDEDCCTLHVLTKGGAITDIVIARKYDHRCARAPGGEVEEPEDDPRTRVAVPRLHDDIIGRDVEQLWQG